jgi:Outer membrane protein beta-barrel family/Carboxypeptidase regulatory-like domain/TonB-dependent Receptor Plug Domain
MPQQLFSPAYCAPRAQRVHRMSQVHNSVFRGTLRCILGLGFALSWRTMTAAQATSPAATSARGYLVGQVVDKASARPLPATNVLVVGTTLRTQTDLDGRFRLPVPAGVISVRVFRLGNVAQQQDGVRINPGVATTVTFALGTSVVQLQGQTVTAAPTKASSEDALLAMQRASSRVSDGISAEAIRRAPGSNAGDAVLRVTGVSIVDSKFAVVRGLAERYSNTLLNGVELPSPEPQKKIVPLDIFPAELLESIVVSKTATPDKPGDFAGGSVEVSTKEFPNTRVADVSLRSGYNSQSTFRQFSFAPQRGLDFLGFDAGGRRQPQLPLLARKTTPAEDEAFAERIRNVWSPAPAMVSPNFGATANFGGRLGGDNAPFGYVLSANVDRAAEATPNRFFQIVVDPSNLADVSQRVSQTANTVDLGGIANFAVRLGASNKIGWKNLYTRNAEELTSRAEVTSPLNSSGAASSAIYQVRYITRSLVQSQLSGDHLFSGLLGSRLEWKATYAVAARDEPENRSLLYNRAQFDTVYRLRTNVATNFWYRFLRDDVRNVQVDWTTPMARLLGDGALLKVGVLAKQRNRKFDATVYNAQPPQTIPTTSAWLSLPPERLFSPELIGTGFLQVTKSGVRALPYEADDNVTAYYAMLDVPVRSWLRIIGGVRREAWALDVYDLRKDTLPPLRTRRNNDLLPSLNATLKLSDRQNLRLAAYSTVARPDPREVTADSYEAVSGDCLTIGLPSLQRTTINNADLRWERYPRSGEILAVSGFAKNFSAPIVELIDLDDGACVYRPQNATSATLRGVEFEFRRGLSFLPGLLKQLSAGVNVTVVSSAATIPVLTGPDVTTTYRTLRLQGQSDRIANVNLLYATTDGRFEMSVLGNYFSDRNFRYGTTITDGKTAKILPDTYEEARFTLDAKIRRRFGRANVSLSARNLTDNERVYSLDGESLGRVVTGYQRPGIGISLGVGYALR